MIRGFFEGGVPFVLAFLRCEELGIFAPLKLLIDTGASRTVIMDRDVIRLGLKYEQLERLEEGVIGVGGRVETYVLRGAELLFESEGGLIEEITDILVLRHREIDERIKRMPSLLGRDILNKYNLYLNAGKNVIEIIRVRR